MIELDPGLLRSILENPADDTARLIAADWLEESGETDRAELIRVQAALCPQYQTVVCKRLKNELIAHKGLEWVLPLARLLGVSEEPGRYPGNRYRYIGTDALVLPPYGVNSVVRYEWSRGFLDNMNCTLADWLREGVKITAAQPVTRLRLTDREPAVFRDGQRWQWDFASGSFEIPHFLPVAWRRNFEMHFTSVEAAKDCAGYLGITWARRMNGLPELA
jgi:uncharacterized protein (TIGR02996 family)